MSNQRYTPEFKDEAARQIVERLCRYVSRGPIALERLSIDGNVLQSRHRHIHTSTTALGRMPTFAVQYKFPVN